MKATVDANFEFWQRLYSKQNRTLDESNLKAVFADDAFPTTFEQSHDFWFSSKTRHYFTRDSNIRNLSMQNTYQQYLQELSLESPLEEFLEYEKTNDPHLIHGLVQNQALQKELDIDWSNGLTTLGAKKPRVVVVFGLDNNDFFQKCIDELSPSVIFFVICDIQDYKIKSNHCDLAKLWNLHCEDPDKATYAIFPDSLASLEASITSYEPVGIDHAYVFGSPTMSDQASSYLSELNSDKHIFSSNLDYMGFTLDEYHMVWNSIRSLTTKPRIYSSPINPLLGRYIVCGSGPSLDESIEKIKELSENSIVIACASNYRTLRKHGIDVHLLCMLERGINEYHNYKEVKDSFGFGSTKLFASVTCDPSLITLFDHYCLFYRPALTPCSIFATNHDQILWNEGPQTVNTGISLACCLGASEILMFGIDLGTNSLEKIRSDNAAGYSNRVYDLTYQGNYQEVVHTNRLMLDSLLIIERALEGAVSKHDKFRAFNAGYGVRIKGSSPFDPTLSENISLKSNTRDPLIAFNDWWSCLAIYSKATYDSALYVTQARQSIIQYFDKNRSILKDDTLTFDQVLSSLQILNSIQFTDYVIPCRMCRGVVLKFLSTINRQLYVLGDNHPLFNTYQLRARMILIDILDVSEKHIIELLNKASAELSLA